MRCVCGHTAHENSHCSCGCSLYEPDDGTYGPRHLYPIPKFGDIAGIIEEITGGAHG